MKTWVFTAPDWWKPGRYMIKHVLAEALPVEEVCKPLTRKIKKVYGVDGKLYCTKLNAITGDKRK